MKTAFSFVNKKAITLFNLFLFVCILPIISWGQTTVTIGGGATVTCPATPTATWTTPPTGVTFSNWSRGSGVTCGTSSTALSGSGFNTASAATSYSGNKYYTFTITADATHTFTLNSFVWNTAVSSGTANFTVQYINNGGTLTTLGTAALTSTSSNTFTAGSTITVAAGTSIVIYAIPAATGASGTTVRLVNGSTVSVTASSASTAPILTTPTATSITENAATLGANITSNGGASITARGTVYKTSTGVTATDNALAEGGTNTGTFTHSRTSLSSETQYYYAGYATNTNGTGLSSESNFRTLSSPPTVQASALTATTASSTEIDLSFTGATFPGAGASQAGYVVIYSTSTPTLSSTNGQAPTAGVGTIFSTYPTILFAVPSTSVNVTGLSNSTAYNFLVVPYTWDGVNSATYNYLTTTAPTASATTNAGPVISITSSMTSFGNIVTATNSSEQTYSVSGSNLIADISLSAPSGFQISLTTATGFGNGLTLTQSGGTVNATTIYVRYSPSSATGAASGNISHTSSSATTQNVAVSGNSISSEPTTSSSVSFGTVTTTSIVVNFTGGNGSNRIVVAKSGSSVSFSPTDATPATGVNANFTSASDQGSGNKIVYDGTGNTITLTGLSLGTFYYFAVYEYNVNTGTSQNYLTSSSGTNNQTTNDVAVLLTTLGTPVTEDFSSLSTSATATLTNGFVVTGDATPNWTTGVNTSATTVAYGSTGTGNVTSTSSGGVINWANGITASATDRSLGFLTTGSFSSPRSILSKIKNTTGSTITSYQISFDYEKYRSGSRQFDMTFFYSTDGTTWTSASSGDQSYTADANNTTINNPPTTTSKSFLISVSVANNSSLFLRWSYTGLAGATNAQGLAVDNISVTGFDATATNVTSPTGTYTNGLNFTSGTNTLSGDINLTGNLNIESGAILAIGNNTLTINGNITGIGTLSGSSTSKIIIGGTGSAGTIYFDQTTSGTTNILQYFTLNRGTSTSTGSVTFGNAIQINGTLTLSNGTLTTGGFLTLYSDINGTARIATIPVTADILGNVKSQRYVPAVQRRYRMFSPNTSSFTYADIIDNIFVSGPGGSTNGFDNSTSNGNTIYTYQESTGGLGRGWQGITAISNTLSAGNGALIFVRGDRTIASPNWYTPGIYPTQNAVTVDFNGAINKGTIAPSITYSSTGITANDGWNLVGNPYPSQINWGTVARTNVDANYYTYDPSSGSYISNTGTSYIASGQAFFVQAIGASPSISFNETDKVSNAATNYFKTAQQKIEFKMIKDSFNSDVAWLEFDPNSSKGFVRDEDALKFPNSLINLGFYIDSLIITQRNSVPLPIITDTFLLTVKASAGTYTLNVSNVFASLPSSKNIFLVDLFNSNQINLRTNSSYTFSINSNPLTFGNRFQIIISDPSLLPVKWLTVTGAKTNTDANINWQTAYEKNNNYYVVERSTENAFEEITNINSKGNSQSVSNYNYTDKNIFTNNKTVFYRIKQVDKDGKFSYSSTIVINNNDKIEDVSFSVFPNPVNDFLKIKSSKIIIGNTKIEVVDVTGKSLITQEFSANDNLVVNTSSLEAGVYFVRISSLNVAVVTRKFCKE